MLDFFRRYERILYILITIVIVISFSFFGTYNSIQTEDPRELPAFRAIDGSLVSKAELHEMVIFLSTDIDDKLLFGGAWGPNFLNDGVLKKDFLQNGVAEILAAQYAVELGPDLEKRLAFEKHYTPYTHPEAQFISSESVWSHYASPILTNYRTLKSAGSPLDPAAFSARVRLFLAEKNFPSYYLRNVLRNQESQFSWLTPDPNLQQIDLSLFGYHTTEDWFGSRFVHIAAEFIINSAKIAEQRGYRVSKTEALAALSQNGNLSFKQNINNPHLGVTSSNEYFLEQLRRMGLDQNRAIKIWQQVLLTRRLFQDAASSVFTSPELFAEFTQHAKESIQGELYQLPKELKLADYASLQKFELYLNAISNRTEQEKTALSLPEKTLTPAKIAQKYPELVQKEYLIEIAQIDKNTLLSKVGIKEMSNWELEEVNWNNLKKEFPELGLKPGESRGERFSILEGLNDKLRNKVDSYARTKILESHPEWISTALNQKTPEIIAIGLPLTGTAPAPFIGVNNTSLLIELLDNSALAENSEKKQNAIEKLAFYTQDHLHYYTIRRIEGKTEPEALTFIEANRQGILDKLLDRELQAHYLKIRELEPEKFQKSDKSWKELNDVKDLVADNYYENLLKAIQAKSKDGSILTGNLSAQQRLLPYVNKIRTHLIEDPNLAQNAIKTKTSETKSTHELAATLPLAEQWKLEKQPFLIDRTTKIDNINSTEAFNLPLNSWSEVIQAPNGAMAFYHKLEVKNEKTTALLETKNLQAKRLLSEDIQRKLAFQLITEFKAKNAITLDYLNKEAEVNAES